MVRSATNQTLRNLRKVLTMSRIHQIAPEAATGKAKELLDAVQGKLGLVPNITRAMANSPSVLEGYLGLSGALGKGGLSAKNREQIALAVGQANQCDYCLAAHSTIGKMVGLTPDQILDSRRGTAVDPKSDALIRFARKVVDERGQVSDADVAEVRAAGLDDGAIAEVVANVALNIFTNYFNHVAETDIDFPKVEPIVDHHEVCASIPGCDPTR
jgi:uncharacterized peroxidase-related enzyme